MAYQVTIITTEQLVNNDGDTLQLIMTIDVDETGSNVSWDAREYGIRVIDWGKYKLECDLEESLLVPGSFSIVLGDEYENLYNLVMENEHTEREFNCLIKKNGNPFFEGTVRDNSIETPRSDLSIRFEIVSKVDLLNNKRILDFEGEATNPLGYNLGGASSAREKVKDVIHDIYKQVNPSVAMDFVQDWIFYGVSFELPDDVTDGTWDEYYIDPYFVFDSNAGFGTTLGDILKNIAKQYFCMTGMYDNNTCFFRKLFYYSESNLQTLGKVIDYTPKHVYHKINYVVARSEGNVYHEEPNSEAFTELEGDYIEIDGIDPNNNFGYWIYRDSAWYVSGIAYDSLINPSNELDTLIVSAKLWYYFRSQNTYCRVDNFVVRGVNYDFYKNFHYKGKKYQIIKIIIDFSENTTEIDAIYLGRVS